MKRLELADIFHKHDLRIGLFDEAKYFFIKQPCRIIRSGLFAGLAKRCAWDARRHDIVPGNPRNTANITCRTDAEIQAVIGPACDVDVTGKRAPEEESGQGHVEATDATEQVDKGLEDGFLSGHD
jgi:hypothetical protein